MGFIENVNKLSNALPNINTVVTNIDDVNTYAKTYQRAKAEDPTKRNDGSSLQEGDLYFNTTINKMKVYDGTTWQLASSAVNGMVKKQTWAGDGTTTSFSVTDGYDTNYAEIYVNGVNVTQGVDLSDGQNIVFNTAPADGAEILGVFFGSFVLADCYTKVEANDIFVNKNDYEDTNVLNKLKNVDGAGSGLDADLIQGVPKDLLGIGGAGYQWVDETGNKDLNVTYTNTTGKPVYVKIMLRDNDSNTTYFHSRLFVDGHIVDRNGSASVGSSVGFTVGGIIPPGSTYRVNTLSNGATKISFWFELK